MLDEAVKGNQSERTDLETDKLSNVHSVEVPTGNTKAAGLRKLRKYVEERTDVAEAYQCVTSE